MVLSRKGFRRKMSDKLAEKDVFIIVVIRLNY